jgi:hypothetical protein
MAAPRKVSKPATKSSTPAAAPAAPVVERSEVKGSGGLATPKTAAAPAKAAARIPTQAEIQKRAYEIYAGRGYAAGDSAADWHEAERQLKAGL